MPDSPPPDNPLADPGPSQPVTTPLTTSAVFLVLTIDEGGESTVRSLLGDAAGLNRAVGMRVPGLGLELVTAIGSQAWDRLFAGPRPPELHEFVELRGDRHHAPSTPGDLLFHIRAERPDACFELARQLTNRLAGAATIVDEVHGFRYFEARDIIGFVDGTENPTGADAVEAVTVSPDTDPHFAGGSYVHVQRYLHDMASWDATSVEEQERVIGRTKLDDIEFPDDVKPANSHVAVNSVQDADGNDLDILRLNMPYGSLKDGELGTYFIAYSATPDVTEQMLENMFIGSPPGNYDRLLDFSTAQTGTLFFAPIAGFFDDMPAAPAAGQTARPVDAPPTTLVVEPGPPPALPEYAGSLRIGSLRDSTVRSTAR